MTPFFSNPSSPREQDMSALDAVSGNTGVHLLAQAIQDRQDSVVIEPPPRRPNAPAPAQSFRAPAEPTSISSFSLGPERPLKLFKMEDFEFLKVLGKLIAVLRFYSLSRYGYFWKSATSSLQDIKCGKIFCNESSKKNRSCSTQAG
jgi:hypothetical protein